MWRLLRDRWRGVTVTVLLQSASTAATLAGPALVGVVVDAVANDSPNAESIVDRAAIAYAVLAVLAAILRYFGGVRAAVVGEDALAEMRTEVFDHAVAVPVDLVERAGTGDLVSRVTSDITILADAVRNAIPVVLLALLEVVFTMGALVLLDFRLAAIALITAIPITFAAGRWYFRRAHTLYRRERERHAALGAGLHESYQGASVLAGFRASTRTRRGLARRGRATVDAEMATTSARNKMRPGISLAQAVSLVAVMALGAALVDDGSLEIGTLSAAALYLVQLFNPVALLLEQSDQLQRATASFARLVGVTQLPVDVTEPISEESAIRLSTLARPTPVQVRDVVFGYDPDTLVLDGVSLDIVPGEHLAIVGPSGAGKTTLGKIIAGLLHTRRGAVRVGGIVVDELDPETRARIVAMVAQEGHVFGRSVTENVRLGRQDASDDDVRAALDAVDALAWAESLPSGIDTQIGVGHQHVSTVRAQQLALARLVCLDPAVVVLDEATAELDPVAAARTERHLDAALGRRTVVTIVHRLDVAERADRVIVLEEGRIVASGHHSELIADPEAVYARALARVERVTPRGCDHRAGVSTNVSSPRKSRARVSVSPSGFTNSDDEPVRTSMAPRHPPMSVSSDRPSPAMVMVSSRAGSRPMRARSNLAVATLVSVARKPFSTGCGGPGVNVIPCSTHSSKPCACGFGPTRSRGCRMLSLTIAYGCGTRIRSARASVVASTVPLSPRSRAAAAHGHTREPVRGIVSELEPRDGVARVEERFHREHHPRRIRVAREVEHLEEHAVRQLRDHLVAATEQLPVAEVVLQLVQRERVEVGDVARERVLLRVEPAVDHPDRHVAQVLERVGHERLAARDHHLDLGNERALSHERDERREAVGVQLADAERGEAALGYSAQDHAVFVDVEARRDVVHDVEYVLLCRAVVAAAPTAPERFDHDRRHVEAPGTEEASGRVAQVVAARAVEEHDERRRPREALGNPHAVRLVRACVDLPRCPRRCRHPELGPQLGVVRARPWLDAAAEIERGAVEIGVRARRARLGDHVVAARQ